MEQGLEGDSARLLAVPERAPENGEMVPAANEDCLVPFAVESLHDLASPINQIGAMVGLLGNRYRNRLDEDAEALFDYMEKSSRHLQTLMAGLNRYVQVVGMPGPYRSCSGDDLLAAAIESIRGTIDSQGALVTHDALPELYCHPVQISTVFASLIENSINFRGEDRPQVHVSADSKEGSWLVSVSDNGLGIAPRHRTRVFEVFTRAHQLANPGAGVGLAIVRRIIEIHQGRIWIESEVGRGTTISFTLPQQECRGVRAIAE